MSVIATEVVVIFVLLLFNGVFAMSELAVVSARKLRLEQRADDGDEGARAALHLAHNPADFLSAVQVGITLIGVMSGAFGGATIAKELAIVLSANSRLAPYADAIGLGIVVAAITFLSLIIGELVPKRIALNNPERIAALVARPMGVVAFVARPIVIVLTSTSNVLLRLLRVRRSNEPGVTEDEIRAMMEQGRESGEVQPQEQEIVESVFRMGDRRAGTIMTPRHDVNWIDLDAEGDEQRESLATVGREPVLVGRGTVDVVVGVLHAEHLVPLLLTSGEEPLAPLIERAARPAYFVPQSMPAFELLDQLKRSGERLAVVLDEYGGVQGTVTLIDILEALVGELPEDLGVGVAKLAQRDDGSWLVDGDTPLDEIVDHELLPEIPMEERRHFSTLAGFVIARLGRLPRVGDSTVWHGVRLEVVDLDGRRVDKVLISPARSLTDDETSGPAAP